MDSIIKSKANHRDHGDSFRGTVALGKMKAEEVAVSMDDAKRPEQSTAWDGTIEDQIQYLSVGLSWTLNYTNFNSLMFCG